MNTQPQQKPQKKPTKTKLVLDWMLDGNSITSIEAFRMFNATRLSAIIFSLKKKGWFIDKSMEFSGDTQFARYFLVQMQPLE